MGKAAGPWSFPTVWRLFKHKEASSAFPTSLPPWESTKERMDRRMGDFEKVLRLSIKVWPWYPSSYLYRIYRTYKKMLSCGKTSSLGAGLHSSPGANRQHQRRNRRYVIAINTHIVSGHYLPSTFKSNQKVSMPNNTSWHDVLGMIQTFHLSFTPMSCKIQLFHLVFIILYVNIYIYIIYIYTVYVPTTSKNKTKCSHPEKWPRNWGQCPQHSVAAPFEGAERGSAAVGRIVTGAPWYHNRTTPQCTTTSARPQNFGATFGLLKPKRSSWYGVSMPLPLLLTLAWSKVQRVVYLDGNSEKTVQNILPQKHGGRKCPFLKPFQSLLSAALAGIFPQPQWQNGNQAAGGFWQISPGIILRPLALPSWHLCKKACSHCSLMTWNRSAKVS